MLGIDASRANQAERTGTEWYSYFLIRLLPRFLPPDLPIIWYVKGPLQKDLLPVPRNVTVQVLKWPPRLLWSQCRLSLEMLLRRPTALFVPAHTIPIIHPRKTVTTLHDVGFEHAGALYSSQHIGNRSSTKLLLNILARIATIGKYGASEIDYHKFSARFAVKHAAHVITVSQYSKDQIVQSYHADPHDISVIYNGFSKEIFHPVRNQEAEAALTSRIGCGDDYILYIGRLEHKKNTANIIRAYTVYRNNHPDSNLALLLIGAPGYGFEEVEMAIADSPFAKDIHLPGWMPARHYVHLLRGARVFLFPSRYEGFGIPVIESMAVGTPVITSTLTSLPEVAGDAAEYVDADSPEDIANGMQRLIQDHDLRRTLIEKGFIRSSMFSWEESARKTAGILTQVLKSS